ncbi:hypothetical protein C0Q70_04112 [Pomacea canaliculata]|uniref:Ion transport domain-containing protein n=1 Tax=Pomacea canaliculata TaxID=400727 RepID=A0A2T7PUQ9_POMCA|nr:hypothetical protein C0Q70_04112 [Pomacea canaliculata]
MECSALCRLRTRPKPVKAPITFTDKDKQENQEESKDKSMACTESVFARAIMEIILFFVIFLILFITYGIIKYSLDNKGEGVVNSSVVLALPVEAFWLTMGDRPEDDDVNDEDPKVIFRGIVRVAYMMFTAVLLINVLIAAFNSLYQRIDDQKQDVRKFQKFQTIVKYSKASVFPPPLNVFYLAWCLICYLKLECGGKDSENSKTDQDDFRMNVKKEDKEKLLKWAKVTTESPKQETPKTIEEIMNKVLDKYYIKRRLEKERRKHKEPANEAKDTEKPPEQIKKLTKLGGSESENLKTVDKMVKSAHYHAAEDTENLSRPINELTRHAESHSKRLEDVVRSLKHAETQAAKDTKNMSRLITELKDLLGCHNGVEMGSKPQATTEAENLSGKTEKIIGLVESLNKRLEDVVQMLQRTQAALSSQTAPTSHVKSPRPATSPRMSGYIVECLIVL